MKPNYEGEFIAFTEFDRCALQSLVRSLNKTNVKIAEIGSWMGNGSTTTLVNELKGTDSQIYCIDHWKGNSNVKRHQDIVAEYDVFNTFRSNMVKVNDSNLVKPMMMSSEEAASVVADHSFDLVFIDGDHSYESTLKDIEMWHSKVVPGGILCGHDCEIKLDETLRDYLWDKRSEDFVAVEHSRYKNVHPGVVLAVDKILGGGQLHIWGEEERSLKVDDKTFGFSSIWDINV